MEKQMLIAGSFAASKEMVLKRHGALRAWRLTTCIALVMARVCAGHAQMVVLKKGENAGGGTTVKVGKSPTAVAVNEVTNKIYVANTDGGSVTVIDGQSNLTETVKVGRDPRVLAVNPVTNKVYVACKNSNAVRVIDGNTNATTKVSTGRCSVIS